MALPHGPRRLRCTDRVFRTEGVSVTRTCERGVTLVEALVSLALVTVVLFAAGPLIVQSARLFVATGRTLTDPSATLAGAWLRRDIHAAAGIDVIPGAWSTDAMALRGHDGGYVTYEASGNALVRRRIRPDGSLVDRRVVMRGLESWRWRSLRGLVDAEVRFAAHVDPTAAAVAEDTERLADLDPVRQRFCFCLRSDGGRSW